MVSGVLYASRSRRRNFKVQDGERRTASGERRAASGERKKRGIMKVAWKKPSGNKRSHQLISSNPNLPFDSTDEKENKSEEDIKTADKEIDLPKDKPAETLGIDLELAESFQSQGNKLAEDGRYREALGKWEAALTLTPERAILHEQKAQVLLEIGDAWNALKAASRATELEPSWAEAWITLGRAQLNFGEPDKSLESFDRCLAIKPDSIEAQADREAALRLVKKRKHLHTSGLMNATETRYKVGDKID